MKFPLFTLPAGRILAIALSAICLWSLRAETPAPSVHGDSAPDAHPAPAATSSAHGTSAGHGASTSETHPSPEVALQRLLDGNARYAAGHAAHPNQTVARRVEVARGQTPFAAIVTCSDSRVAPELYLDQGLGDLFVVRDAGNVINDHVIGSLEYAVEHLHVSLILVIGHEKCGAVSAAVSGGRPEGRIATIVDSIRPAVQETRHQAGDKVDNAIRTHARRGAVALASYGPILAPAIRSGEVKIFAARYDLASGRIELIP